VNTPGTNPAFSCTDRASAAGWLTSKRPLLTIGLD